MIVWLEGFLVAFGVSGKECLIESRGWVWREGGGEEGRRRGGMVSECETVKRR